MRARRAKTTAFAAMMAAVVMAIPGGAQMAGASADPDWRDGRGGEDAAEVAVIYLFRHAETADDDPRDPNLSQDGVDRAIELARILADVPVSNVFSTPYRRTMGTAQPVAGLHGVPVRSYDPGNQDAMTEFVGVLSTTPGHHLVSGHSNTTPALVEALGGDPGEPIDHAEYDRLYILTVHPDGAVTTSLLRYGAAFEAEGHDRPTPALQR